MSDDPRAWTPDLSRLTQAADDAFTVGRVFGPAYEHQGALVIPVARVLGAAGTGAGGGAGDGSGSGSGSGSGNGTGRGAGGGTGRGTGRGSLSLGRRGSFALPRRPAAGGGPAGSTGGTGSTGTADSTAVSGTVATVGAVGADAGPLVPAGGTGPDSGPDTGSDSGPGGGSGAHGDAQAEAKGDLQGEAHGEATGEAHGNARGEAGAGGGAYGVRVRPVGVVVVENGKTRWLPVFDLNRTIAGGEAVAAIAALALAWAIGRRRR